MTSVRIFEMFTSIEGEGILCGTKTLFVRLAGCPFTCFYCDTTEALPPSSGTEYTIREAERLVDDALQDHTYKVNFTGGDPLIQHEAVAKLAEHVHSAADGGILTYLESSCFDAGRFSHVLPHIDVAKIEFKTSDSGFVNAGRAQEMTGQALECLERALAAGKRTYVKVVVSSKTATGEVQRLAEAVRDISDAADPRGAVSGFVIQPVHVGDANSSDAAWAPSLQQLITMYDAVRPIHKDVRVIPQLHKMIGAP